MKKSLLTLLSVLVVFTTMGIVCAKPVSNSDLTSAIKLYKNGNYSECYSKLGDVIKKDPANALAYYYMAMTSAQMGRKDEAISNYDKAITLAPNGNNLNRYAKKGKRCLETPDKCEEAMYESGDDEFIRRKGGPNFTEEVQSNYEQLKIENFMREMNREDSIEPRKFKEYKDFSSVPTNDEIVAALRTLQRAGFGNVINSNYADLSVLTGNSQQNSMLNMMGGTSMNPQLIQALLTNNMTQGF